MFFRLRTKEPKAKRGRELARALPRLHPPVSTGRLHAANGAGHACRESPAGPPQLAGAVLSEPAGGQRVIAGKTEMCLVVKQSGGDSRQRALHAGAQ